ncbi:MAG TPA: substrate-binding domain-containing protein [Tepidisphaeraceae bacterium]|nr:substrate-binding domain-containing protein [Tepidisphaeraceae bacterium]
MPRPRIAILANSQIPFDRAVVRGIAKYGQLEGRWEVYFNPEEPYRLPNRRAWPADGVIFRANRSEVRDEVRASGLPIVGVGGRFPVPGAPLISVKLEPLVELAVDYFVSRGYRRFGYCSEQGMTTLMERAAGFSTALAARGLSCNVYAGLPREQWSSHWGEEMAGLANWLSGLEPPVAVLAANDERATHVLQACALAGLAVPEKVAVLGVDNDEDRCLTCSPPLSSIDLDIERIGYQAAEMLADWLATGTPGPSRSVSPRGVVTRQSTDALAVEQPDVVAALQFIHRNAHRRIDTSDLLDNVPVARRSLELLFRQHVGRSPRQEIEAAHLRRAKMLLTETSWSLKKVAGESGFGSVERLCKAFRRVVAQTPLEYRKTHGAL